MTLTLECRANRRSVASSRAPPKYLEIKRSKTEPGDSTLLIEKRFEVALNANPSSCGKTYHTQCKRAGPINVS